MNVKLNGNNTKMIEELFRFLTKNPELIDHNLTTQSALTNVFLSDYLAALIQQWNKRPKAFYVDLKRKLLFNNKETQTTQLLNLEHSQMDRINMILYLLIDTNKAIVRSNNKSYLQLQSMFDGGTSENEIYAKLSDLVAQDNQDSFKKSHRQGRNLL